MSAFNYKSIGFYAHKGGVGKTTLAFDTSVGLVMLKEQDIIMIDCDAQLNLTFKCLQRRGIEITSDLIDSFLNQEDSGYINLGHESYSTVFSAMNSDNETRLFRVLSTGEHNLYCLLGSPKIHTLESQLLLSMNMQIPMLRLFPSRFHDTMDNLKRRYEAHIVVDLSPSSNALTQNFLLSCDAFVLPLTADYHSLTSQKLVLRYLPEWFERHSQHIQTEHPKLLMCIHNAAKRYQGVLTIAEGRFHSNFRQELSGFHSIHPEFCFRKPSVRVIGDLAGMAKYLSLSYKSIFEELRGPIDNIRVDDDKVLEIREDSMTSLNTIHAFLTL